jgi:hypothetical protein
MRLIPNYLFGVKPYEKIAVFTVTIFVTILFAGVYGIVHDQITYSISPEYFTKFKFEQFGLEPQWFGGDRQTVAVIGFLATWWTGIFIGLGLGFTALIFRDYKSMWKALGKAMFVTFSFAVANGVFGFFYGRFGLTEMNPTWWFPENITDKHAFNTVGTIHNFSYLGGLIGLVAGIYYLIKRNRLDRADQIQAQDSTGAV